MGESPRLVWMVALKACSEINMAMQEFTTVNYTTPKQHKIPEEKVEQHKEMSRARQKKDMADTRELINFLEPRDPFQVSHTLQNIVTGVTAEASVNVDCAKDVGEKT